MQIAKIAVIATATAAAAIALPATAQARINPPAFQSPSGNVLCFMNNDASYTAVTAVQCYVSNHAYVLGTGDCSGKVDFVLEPGKPAQGECGGDPGAWAPPPTLGYGQTRSVGTLTCDSEPAGITCTDSSTGHFFRAAADSYQMG
jgi:uncharacterized protein DUF6636